VRYLEKLLSAIGPFLGLIFVYLVFCFVAPPEFHSIYNTKLILSQTVIFGIAALGMTLVIISGGIDLSVGSLVALGTVVTATFVSKYGGQDPGILIPATGAVLAVLACGFCGFITGSIVAGFGIVSFIVTLGMMQVARGVAKGLAGQTTVTCPTNWLNDMMIVEPAAGAWWSIAPAVWVMLGLLGLMYVVLHYTVFGRRIFAVGSNESTARLCGIRVRLNKVWVFTLSGVFAGLASVMQFSNLTLGDPTAAVGMELKVIAAVVIGGGSLRGGEGTVVGSIIGAIIMAMLQNGCNLAGVPNYVQNIITGAIIITAVGVDRLRHGRQTEV